MLVGSYLENVLVTPNQWSAKKIGVREKYFKPCANSYYKRFLNKI